ncbi:MAG: translation initiation factor IF-2 [Firmicutes bacterium]|nr:translation initiation factor IF-2 [Bacillota bacterium]
MPGNTNDTETRIVKAATKKEDQSKDANASKVQIRQVDIAIIQAQQARAKAAKTAAANKKKPAETAAPRTQTLPAGAKPVPRSAAQSAARAVPTGARPMPKNAVPMNAVPMKKSDVPQNTERPAAAAEAAEQSAAAARAAAANEAQAAEEKAAQAAKAAEAAEAEKQAPAKAAKKENAGEGKSAPAASEIPEKPAKKEQPEKAAQPAEADAGAEGVSKPEQKAGTEKAAATAPSDKKADEQPVKAEEAVPGSGKQAPVKAASKEAPKAQSPDQAAAPKSSEKAKAAAPADKAQAAKPADKASKSAASEAKKDESEKKPEAKIDYVPNIGVKIIRRAADEPAPAPRKPVEPKRVNTGKNDRRQGPGQQGRNPAGQQGDRRQRFGKNDGSGQGAPNAGQGGPRKRPSAGAAQFQSSAPAPAQGDSRRGKGGNKKKDDDRNRKMGRFDDVPADLSRSIKKKHSKYKERVEDIPTQEDELFTEAAATGSVVIDVPITLAGFCEQVERSTSQAIMALMKMGIMANINQNLDEETAVLLGMELGVSVMVNHNEEIEEEEGIDKREDRESELQPRAPIVTVMGHVDHGKTSLLDAIRSTNVTAGEAGGITQHIGASEIEINGQHIVFLDTPGHEAFTAMRARGAHVTDIAVLVVAADDSVMPQTIESISHAKAAGVPIIVAINKMDKPGANPEKVKADLANNGVLVEDWGGEVISVPVSAKTGDGIKQLLEMILLQAEVLELRANPDRLASGTVIEARLDKTRGPVASLLVMNGTLQAGAAIVAGTAAGRVRVMNDSKGDPIRKAGPAHAVEITGLTEVPEAGDEFYMVKDEKTAREISERRKLKLREEVMARSSAVSLEKLFSQLEEGEVKDLNLIVKADVQGSVGALEQSLEKLKNENVRVRIIHSGVGAINESDVVLASTSNAVIIGFNVRPSSAVSAMAEQEGVEIRTYRIIYEIIDDIEAAMKGMLDPEFIEVVLGKAEVRETFKVSNVGTIAGCYVTEGKIQRSSKLRLVRDGIVIHEGEIGSLRRFKDDVREVASGYECGISIEKFNDIKEGDVIEAYEMQEVKRD